MFSQGRGYLNLSSPEVEIFDCRLGQTRLRPNICFPLPRFTHNPYGVERSGNHGGQPEQARAEWISLFCLQISFVLGSGQKVWGGGGVDKKHDPPPPFGTKMTDQPLKQGWKLHDPPPSLWDMSKPDIEAFTEQANLIPPNY